jgi:hypothetical protein
MPATLTRAAYAAMFGCTPHRVAAKRTLPKPIPTLLSTTMLHTGC